MTHPTSLESPVLDWAGVEQLLFARARGGMKLGLERMERALAALGHPEWCAPVLHVAGTNGKGSTCAFLESVLRASGRRTGLYTSPHLECFGERMRVDGVPAGESALLAAWMRLQQRVPWLLDDGSEGLTFFECVTLLGLELLASARPQALVVEVGLGGRLDATNIVAPLVCAIAPVGRDHEAFLGTTLTQIAAEKAGIIKAGVPVVSAAQEPEAMVVIERCAREVGAPLSVEGRDFRLEAGAMSEEWTYVSGGSRVEGLRLGLRGVHQQTNAAVALRVLELAADRGLATTADDWRRGLAAARWPGRLERLAWADRPGAVAGDGASRPEVLLDGAHNGHAAVALAASLRALYPGRTLHLLLGVLADKDVRPVLEPLLPLADRIAVTQPPGPRALSAIDLTEQVRSMQREVAIVEGDPLRALEALIDGAGPDDIVVACGSLYLIGALRASWHGRVAGGPAELLRPAG